MFCRCIALIFGSSKIVIAGILQEITSLVRAMEDLAGERHDARHGMNWNVKKTIVMVGMMGVGKTAVGRALAGILDAPFFDSDAEIERAANMTIAEIFDRDGEPFFRKKESQVLGRLLDAEVKGVVSTGGGAFLNALNRRMISQRGVSVCLEADLGLLWNRVKHKNSRPLLHTANPYETLANLYKQRAPTYALADIRLRARPDCSISEMARCVLDALRQRPDVLEKTT